jgi:hypothetical protein
VVAYRCFMFIIFTLTSVLLNHLYLILSKCQPRFLILSLFSASEYFPVIYSLFVLNHFSFKYFILQFPVSKQSNNTGITSSSPKHDGHLPLSVFLLIPSSCHTPASSHGIQLLSFFEHHSIYNLIPEEKLISRYRVNELFSDLLTPWSRVLLQKLTGSQPAKKFHAFHGSRRFITALSSVRHLSLS